MARYEATSVQFGEALKTEREEERAKIAKEEESFAKKLAGTKFVVKGVNEYLDSRATKLKTSLADEKAFLQTVQSNAQNFLNTHKTNVVDANINVRDYLDKVSSEYLQTLAEQNVEGIMTQVEKDGKLVEIPRFDIPKATLKNLSNFTIGGKTYGNYQEFLDEQVASYEQALLHAQSVPTDAASLDTYLNQYAKEQLPTNIFSFVTGGVRRLLKGETSESLEDKINKSTSQVLSDPLFRKFNKFSNSFKMFNKSFPNKITDFVDNFKNNLQIDSVGNIIDNKFAKKIISDIDVSYETNTIEKVNSATNRLESQITITPKVKTQYIDNSIKLTDGPNVTALNGDNLLVTLDSALLKTFNDILSEKGLQQFNLKISDPTYIGNPIKAFEEVIDLGFTTDGPNMMLKGDIDVNASISKLFESPEIKRLVDVALPLTREEYIKQKNSLNLDATYEEYLKQHQLNSSDIIKEVLNTIIMGLRKTGQ